MSCRAVILTEIISPYRIPVFNALAENPQIDLKVIFLAETDPDLRQWQIYKNEIRFPYEILPSWRHRLGKHSVLLNRGLAASLTSSSPEVIVCGGYNYFASWTALRWAKRNETRFMLWTESTGSDARSANRIADHLKKRFLSHCHGVVVPGISSRRYVRAFQFDDKCIFTASNAVDTDFFAVRAEAARANAGVIRQQLGLPPRYFLFVGRLVREKGVFDLLDAYAALSIKTRAQIGLVFAGDGSTRSELEHCARSQQLDSIRFTGFAQREQLANYYALADVFVFPTHSDPWGLVVNEAMACALPVISTTVAGCAADLVRDGLNGRLVTAGNIAELSTAMAELSSQESARLSMGQRSRQLIREFSPESCASGMAEAMLSGKGLRKSA
jgi:glycosyltransferase involved in cell wall biosynthesis